MGTTPEGRVKRKVSALLKRTDELYGGLFYDMPVPSGFGKSTLDYVGCFRRLYFVIETKAPGKKPTARQQLMIQQVRDAGGAAFVVSGDDGLEELTTWLTLVGQISRS